MRKQIFYIANTPFQLYVISNIISLYFEDDEYENVVISTVSDGSIITNYDRYIYIRRNMKAVYDLNKMKKIILKNINNAIFFIPHVNSLLGSYFFYLSHHYSKEICVYYEGIALFYNSSLKNRWTKILERYTLAYLSGIRYFEHVELYPRKLLDVATCYTPVVELCGKFRNIKKIDFINIPFNKSENILILTDIKMDNADIELLINTLKHVVSKEIIIYLKPHYILQEAEVLNLLSHLKCKFSSNVILLDKNKPIECFYGTLSFGTIISQHFSSALINFRCMYGDDVSIELVNEIKGEEECHIAKAFNLI